MDSTAHSILDAALRLSDTERAAIAKSLLDSLAQDAEELEDEALGEELDRRLAEFKRGEGKTIAWSELRSQR